MQRVVAHPAVEIFVENILSSTTSHTKSLTQAEAGLVGLVGLVGLCGLR